MQKEKFEEDPWLYPRYDLLFVIKNDNETVYEPNRYGDCTDASPFIKGYIPRVGERLSLQRRIYSEEFQKSIIDGYDNDSAIPVYEIKTIRMKIVETSQQRFQTIYYLDVDKIGYE